MDDRNRRKRDEFARSISATQRWNTPRRKASSSGETVSVKSSKPLLPVTKLLESEMKMLIEVQLRQGKVDRLGGAIAGSSLLPLLKPHLPNRVRSGRNVIDQE